MDAKRVGFERIRITESVGQNLYNLALTDRYFVSHWLEDPTVDTELKNRFRLIVANPPLFNKDELFQESEFKYSEFKVDVDGLMKDVIGLGVAYLMDTLSVSLRTNNKWCETAISLQRSYFDSDENLCEDLVNVLHLSDTTHLEYHSAWLEQKRRSSLQKSADLWKKREEFFPNIVLCGDVQRQITRIGFSSHFDQIISRLRTLDHVASQWKEGNFNLDSINQKTNLRISGESKSTLRKFSGERKFKLPDGRRELHEFHIKTGDLRFHFFPDNESKTIYVGYIGPHLNTSSE